MNQEAARQEQTDGASRPRFGVMISTLGTRPELRELLQSLATQTEPPHAVGIADQGTSTLVADVVREFESRLPIHLTRTGSRGLSAGRNDAINASPSDITHYLFPNDTSTYPERLLEELGEHLGGADVCAMSYVDSLGVRNAAPAARPPDLTLAEVFSIIEAGMAVSARRLLEVGGFDEMIGTGSSGKRQSGEGTDLLLRMMQRGPLSVRWLPELRVTGVTQGYGLSQSAEASKARRYGYGYGYILQHWRFPVGRRIRAVIGPIILSLRRQLRWRVGVQSALGRLDGLIAAMRETTRRPDALGRDR
ncbi:glycosyltransferase family 2 protein [Microbacterium sp. 22195]|uniref:glycosyltransferase family 2 protein n=1 Tax=Microbacterium sp. 22195 TaxID=3453891 RepID=UPI003F878FC4